MASGADVSTGRPARQAAARATQANRLVAEAARSGGLVLRGAGGAGSQHEVVSLDSSSEDDKPIGAARQQQQPARLPSLPLPKPAAAAAAARMEEDSEEDEEEEEGGQGKGQGGPPKVKSRRSVLEDSPSLEDDVEEEASGGKAAAPRGRRAAVLDEEDEDVVMEERPAAAPATQENGVWHVRVRCFVARGAQSPRRRLLAPQTSTKACGVVALALPLLRRPRTRARRRRPPRQPRRCAPHLACRSPFTLDALAGVRE